MPFEEIVSVKSLGKQKSIDITVNNKDHTFYANDIEVSNSYSYGHLTYFCAYIKEHFPIEFYQSWLTLSHDKSDPRQEIRELINDARLRGIEIYPPSMFLDDPDAFPTDGENIYFRMGDVKGIGPNKLIGLKSAFSSLNEKSTSLEVFSSGASPSLIEKLIKVGAMKHTGKSRSLLLAELKSWSALTKSEQAWVKQCGEREIIPALKKLAPTKKEGGGTSKKDRAEVVNGLIRLLENPPSPLLDTPAEIAYNEEDLLGISLTCSAIDACDISEANCTVREFLTGRSGYMSLAVKVDSVQVKVTKTGKSQGKKFASVNMSDSSGALSAVCWSDQFKDYGDLLTDGNTILVQLTRDKKEANNGVIQKVKQI